jgi:hypothetical protein
MRQLLCALAIVLGIGVLAEAQQSISVNIDQAKFQWTWVQGTGSPAVSFRIRCGTAAGVYSLPPFTVPFPATIPPANQYTQPVKPVLPGPGTYFCVVTSVNQFGESASSNEVAFAAGTVPAIPNPLNLISQ